MNLLVLCISWAFKETIFNDMELLETGDIDQKVKKNLSHLVNEQVKSCFFRESSRILRSHKMSTIYKIFQFRRA